MGDIMWNIKPSINKCFDCFTGLIVSFCEYNDIPYTNCFLQSWGFNIHDKISGKIVDNISLCNPNSFFSNLEDYYGLKMEQKNMKTSSDLHEYINNNINIMPIIINVDAYNCSWCEIYQKYHFSHFIMIVDSTNNCITINDSYFPIDAYEKIDYIDVSLLNNKVYSLNIQNTNLKNFNYLYEIEKITCFMDENKVLENIIKLMELFITPNILLREVEEYDNNFQFSPIFLLLKRFADDRKCYSMALEIISKNIFKEAISSFNYTNNLYLNLINTILKGIIVGKINSEKIENVFHKIYIQENESLQLLKKVIQ